MDQAMMKSIERVSFANIQEFRDYASKASRLVYYYVFNFTPDQRMIDPLSACGQDEALLLLDITQDRGLLRQTDVTVDITPDREFVTRKMSEHPGLGAWAKGTFVDFVTDPSDIPSLIEYSRRFALPSSKT